MVDAVRRARQQQRHPLQIPAHRGRYAWDPSTPGSAYLADILRDDVPLQGGADDNSYSGRILEQAEELWAEAIGVDRSRFLVGGSSQGNIAALTTVGGNGASLAVDRTSHRSAHAGLIVSGAKPRWIFPELHPEFGLPIGIAPSAVQGLLQDCTGIFLTSPSYIGTLTNIAAITSIAHPAGVIVIADQAWGAHLDFLPGLGAAAQGADIITTSIHKALLGYTQTAICSAQGPRLNLTDIDRSVDLIATTSPSATLLASIDGTRAFLEDGGVELLYETIDHAAALRQRLRAVPGLVVIDEQELGCLTDPLKVTLWLPRTGVSGLELANAFWQRGHGVESADIDTIVFTLSMLDNLTFLTALGTDVIDFIEWHRDEARPAVPASIWKVVPDVVTTPREAYFAPRRRIKLEDAIGEISAEQFCPYPPGVPLVTPGERITNAAVSAIKHAGIAGRVAFNSDPTLQTVEVVDG